MRLSWLLCHPNSAIQSPYSDVIFQATKREKKSIQVEASDDGSPLRKIAPAKARKSKSSLTISSSKKGMPTKRFSSPTGSGVFGVRVFIPKDRNPSSSLSHVELEEHISFNVFYFYFFYFL